MGQIVYYGLSGFFIGVPLGFLTIILYRIFGTKKVRGKGYKGYEKEWKIRTDSKMLEGRRDASTDNFK